MLGVSLLNVQQAHDFIQSALYGLGASLGFTLALVNAICGYSGTDCRCRRAKYFQGSAISLITAGLMALAFIDFSGLVKE